MNQKPNGFFSVYFSDIKGLSILFVVCAVIAVFTHAINQIGWLTNFAFSLCFGLPISLLESYLRSRPKPLSARSINLISVSIGSLFGVAVVYSYLVWANYIEFGETGPYLFSNFAIGLFLSTIVYYLFWSRYQAQALALELKEQQLQMVEKEGLRQQAENRLLQAQMEPHFMFNTLATIQTLIDIDQKQAKAVINDLSRLLRATMNNATIDTYPLRDELNLVRVYLKIQQVRFGERLVVEENIQTELLETPIMPMLIQPLVENAIRHGVEPSIEPVTLVITLKQQNDLLVVIVKDNANNVAPGKTGNGISLKNIKRRLDNRYEGTAQLNCERTQDGWVSALTFPVTTGH